MTQDANMKAETGRAITLSPSSVLGVAIWFALATGLLEAAVLVLRIQVLKQKVLLLGWNSLWMASVGNLLWFGLVALVLVILGRLRTGILAPGRVIGVFSLLSAFALVPMLVHVHWLASLLLALGFGIQTGRLAGGHSGALTSMISRTRIGLLGVVALVAALVLGIDGWREHRARAGLPAAPAGAPNVLLLVLDTVRALNLSLYGYGRPTTPHLAEWARRGVRFDLALAAAPWTLPSHATLFTGRWPHELSSTWRQALDDRWPTLAEVLRDHGYVTGGFVGNLQYCSRLHGLARGFEHYDDFPVTPVEVLLSTSIGRALTNSVWLRRMTGYGDVVGRRRAADLDARFLGWEAGRGSRPFFGFINYYDAHQPFMPPEDLERQFASATPRKNQLKWYGLHEISRWDQDHWTPAELQREMDAYDASIVQLDRDIGALLENLDRRGVLQNTIVIITSDHGEQFGEHGLHNHGNSLYSQLLHVPLIISYPPKVPAAAAVGVPVSLRDIPATILELTGIGPDRLPGKSFADSWKQAGAGGQDPPLLAEVVRPDGKAMISAASGGLHLIRNPDGSEELYDFPVDLTEDHDLLPAHRPDSTLGALRALLDSLPPQPAFTP